jgi:hypothetical protein
MAETQASSSRPRPAAIPTSTSGSFIRPTAPAFTPPRTAPASGSGSSGAPWRSVGQPRPSLSAVQAAQVGSPPAASGSFGRMPSASTSTPSQRGLSSGSKVFTPTKTPSTANVTRNPSG